MPGRQSGDPYSAEDIDLVTQIVQQHRASVTRKQLLRLIVSALNKKHGTKGHTERNARYLLSKKVPRTPEAVVHDPNLGADPVAKASQRRNIVQERASQVPAVTPSDGRAWATETATGGESEEGSTIDVDVRPRNVSRLDKDLPLTLRPHDRRPASPFEPTHENGTMARSWGAYNEGDTVPSMVSTDVAAKTVSANSGDLQARCTMPHTTDDSLPQRIHPYSMTSASDEITALIALGLYVQVLMPNGKTSEVSSSKDSWADIASKHRESAIRIRQKLVDFELWKRQEHREVMSRLSHTGPYENADLANLLED